MRRKRQSPVNLNDLAGRFSDALGFIECALKALRADDDGGPELLVLEHGVESLLHVHRDLDRALAE